MPAKKKPAASVPEFLATVEHARKDEVEAVRKIVLGASEEITEQVKWNAPSFCWNGDDRVTMRLQPKDRVELIFHRGAKVKDAKGFSFEDESGLIEWLAKDRGIVAFTDAADVKKKKPALQKLVLKWMKATE